VLVLLALPLHLRHATELGWRNVIGPQFSHVRGGPANAHRDLGRSYTGTPARLDGCVFPQVKLLCPLDELASLSGDRIEFVADFFRRHGNSLALHTCALLDAWLEWWHKRYTEAQQQSEGADMQDADKFVQANPYFITPGMPYIFRNAGTGPARTVVAQPRGPLGQCMVRFEGGFTLAVNERELFDHA
jgi:hypothetical protein